MVPSFWVFLRPHFTHGGRNGELSLVSGALGTVTSLCHLAKITYDHTYECHVEDTYCNWKWKKNFSAMGRCFDSDIWRHISAIDQAVFTKFGAQDILTKFGM